MENCWGTTPVTNHNSPTATKSFTPCNYLPQENHLNISIYI
jgi:hypothetical protein